jgi:hypothetical protein
MPGFSSTPAGQRLLALLDSAVPAALYENADELRRSRVLVGLLVCGIAACSAMFGVRLLSHGWAPPTLATLAGAALFGAVLWWFARTGSRRVAGVAAGDGGLVSRAITWFPVLPLIGGFVGHRLAAMGASLVVIACLTMLWIGSSDGLLPPRRIRCLRVGPTGVRRNRRHLVRGPRGLALRGQPPTCRC